MTLRNVRKQGWVFPVIFSRLQWPIEPKFSQVCYFLYQLWYTKCGPLDNTVYRKCPMALKAVDTIGNCQSLAFTVGVSQHMHKITNLWKFELNRSSNLRDNNERKKHPCHTKLCAFRWLISIPQVLNLRSWNQILGKLLLSRKLWHFRGSRFSQCFIPSTSPHDSSPRKVLC